MLGDIRQKPLDFGVAHAVDELDEEFLTGRNSGAAVHIVNLLEFQRFVGRDVDVADAHRHELVKHVVKLLLGR